MAKPQARLLQCDMGGLVYEIKTMFNAVEKRFMIKCVYNTQLDYRKLL